MAVLLIKINLTHSLGIITYFCPCYIIGKNAEAVGDSCFLCGAAHFFQPINLWARVHIRGKIREQKGIPVSQSL